MLAQSLSLSLLTALAAGVVALAFSGDLLLSARITSLPVAAALLFGCWAQVRTMRAHVQREINRAVIFRAPPPSDPLPVPNQPEPAVKPVESVRLVPFNHWSPPARPAASATFASDAQPLFPANREIDGVPEKDLRYFIELLPAKGGHQRRRWIGTVLPSGRKVDTDYYELLVAPLVKCGAIVGRAPRVAGTLTCSPQTMKERLGLAP